MPGATPPSPPSSPEKEENETKLEQISPNQHQTNPNQNTAKTIQALLQQRIQQFQQNNKQNAFLMRNVSLNASPRIPG